MENDDIRRRRPEDEVIGSANIGGEGEFEDDELEDEEFDEGSDTEEFDEENS